VIRLPESVRRVAFVARESEVPQPHPDTVVVVLDTTWTPAGGEPADLIPARALVGQAVEQVDLFDGALRRVDSWADATGIADRLIVEGVTYWFRLRETMWRWLHERVLWREILRLLDPDRRVAEITLPAGETALADVAEAHGIRVAQVADPSDGQAPQPTPARPGRRRHSPEVVRREELLARRMTEIVTGSRPRVVVLTNPRTYQRIGGRDGRAQDPLFGAVIPRLVDAGLEPVLVAPWLDHRNDEDWAWLAPEPRMLPRSYLLGNWSAPGDADRASDGLSGLEEAIGGVRAETLRVGNADLTPIFIGALRENATRTARADVRLLAALERWLGEVRPSAILLAQEGIHTPWLVAARRAGLPLFALQHGVLYGGHPGYPNRRHPALVLPTRMLVYGEAEREVLVSGAHRDDEVEVVGSPRLDLDLPADDPDRATAEGTALREELGVATGDRLLVVSTVNLRFVQRSHFVHTLARVLGGPLPRTHIVFKQHPGEFDDGPYRDLLFGLARAGGYPPPAISVVKDIDLYRLLRAADAHLGILSTVLTEAVAVGTPNLIGMVDAHADLLGYVDAGVARPVRTPKELLAALDDPRPSDAAARAEFLARHFRPGDAAGRIVATVANAVGAGRGVA
jgi:hypothetical protein